MCCGGLFDRLTCCGQICLPQPTQTLNKEHGTKLEHLVVNNYVPTEVFWGFLLKPHSASCASAATFRRKVFCAQEITEAPSQNAALLFRL